jgi:hypothetical protein
MAESFVALGRGPLARAQQHCCSLAAGLGVVVEVRPWRVEVTDDSEVPPLAALLVTQPAPPVLPVERRSGSTAATSDLR